MIERAQKTLLVVVALALFGLAAAVGLFSAGRAARAASPELPVAAEVADAPSAALVPPSPVGVASTGPEQERELVAEAEVELAAVPTVLLRGRLREHVYSDASVEITVTGVWGGRGVQSEIERIEQRFQPASRGSRADVDRLGWDGSFELEVTALFRPGRPDALAVSARSDGRAGWTSVPVGDAGAPGAGPRVLTATVDFDNLRAVSGEVRPASGARVAAFHLLEGVPVRRAVDHANVAEDGTFQLSLPVANAYLVVAYAKGLRPSSREWYLGFERGGLLPAFQLDHGATIQGSVSLGGRSVGATVAATPERRDSRGFVAGGDELFLIEGSLEWGATSARARSDGYFELTGLAPGDYSVHVSGVALEDGASVGRLRTMTVTAPAVGLDLSPEAAWVRLEFLGDLTALARTGYALEQDFGNAGKTMLTVRPNAQGLAQLWLSPGDPVRGIGTSFEFLPRDCASGPPCVVDVREP